MVILECVDDIYHRPIFLIYFQGVHSGNFNLISDGYNKRRDSFYYVDFTSFLFQGFLSVWIIFLELSHTPALFLKFVCNYLSNRDKGNNFESRE